MEILKNKLTLGIIAILLFIIIGWLYWPHATVKKEKLTNWVANGYTQQFCKVIYPQVSSCVTFSANECSAIAKEQINDCITKSNAEIPESANAEKANQVYRSFAECFQKNMQQTILSKYLEDTAECRERMR